MPKEMLKISSLQPNEIGPLLCIEFLIAARTTKILVSPADHTKDKLESRCQHTESQAYGFVASIIRKGGPTASVAIEGFFCGGSLYQQCNRGETRPVLRYCGPYRLRQGSVLDRHY